MRQMLRPGPPPPGRAYSALQTPGWIWGGESEMETTRSGQGTEGKGNKGEGSGKWGRGWNLQAMGIGGGMEGARD